MQTPTRADHHRPPVDEALLARLVGEYAEMPGLSLTLSQAQRLWRLDEATCRTALTTLVRRQLLLLTPRGHYVRRDGQERHTDGV